MYHLVKSLYLHYTSKEEYSILLLGLDNAGKTTFLNQTKALYGTTNSALSSKAPSSPPSSFPSTTAAPSPTAGNTVPTVGQNVATIDLPDMYLKIWDIGGQVSLRRLWYTYYKSAHAVIFLVDSTDIGSEFNLAKLPGFIDHVRKKNSVAGDSLLSPTATTAMSSPLPHTKNSPGFSAFSGGGGGVGVGGAGGASGSANAASFGRLDECRQVLEAVLQHGDMEGIPILVLANKQDREDCVEVVRIKEGFVRPLFEGEKGGMVRDSRVLPVSALRGTGVKEAVEWVRTRVLWNKEGRAPVMR
jgi:ADP-ribosylation factor related protein 1